MGRFYLPPQVLVAVAVLAAVGAVLLILARPAAGSEAPARPAAASAPPAVATEGTSVSAV